MKTATFTLLGLLYLGNSTCRGQSNGPEGVAKGPESATPSATAEGKAVDLPGVDTSPLTPREKKEWASDVSDFLAPCADVPVSIAQCVTEKRNCSRCLPAAKFILKGVRDGMSRDQIETAYKNRFAADRVKDVPVDGSPTKGPDGAPVTIVEFADFECPFCGVMAPRLDELVKRHGQQVRFVFKCMPLPAHPHGEIAARAAVAAGAQGKFWEMHKKLFDNQKHLEQADLEGYAKDLALDLPKFRAAMNAAQTTDRLGRDRKLADALQVKGTPTIYINGREFDARTDPEEWIEMELSFFGGSAPSAPPTAAAGASAAPSGAPANAKGDGARTPK